MSSGASFASEPAYRRVSAACPRVITLDAAGASPTLLGRSENTL